MNQPVDHDTTPLARVERLLPSREPTFHVPTASARPGFWTLLARYRTGMLTVFAITLAVGLGLVFLLIPEYVARVELVGQPHATTTEVPLPDELRTQTRRMIRPEVRTRIANQHQTALAANEHWLWQTLEMPRTPAQILADAVTVDVESPLVWVSVRLPRAADTAPIANDIAQAFLDEQHQRQIAQSQSEHDRTVQITALREQLQHSDQRIDELRQQARVLEPAPVVTQQRNTLDQMTRSWEDLQIEIASTRELLAAVEDRLAQNEKPKPEAMEAEVRQDGQFQALQAALEDARRAASNARDRFGPAHPDRVAADRRVAQMQREVDRYVEAAAAARTRQTEAAPLLDIPADERPQALRQKLRQLEGKKAALAAMLQARDDRFGQEFAAAEELVRQERHRADLATRLTELRSQQAPQDRITVERVAAAVVPHRATVDHRPLVGLVSVFSALVFSFGFGAVRVLMSGALRQMDHNEVLFADHFGAPLGLVPGGDATTPTEFALQSEAIRMVRTALLDRLPRSGGVVQVTSAGPAAGKTGVAISLAESLAALGKRTLLVDADLRNPGVARRLGLTPQVGGLLEALEAKHQAQPTGTPDLDVVPQPRPVTADEATVLASDAVEAAFDHWRNEYDYVVVDSSPVLPVADARLLSRCVDGSVLVVREQHCERSDVFAAVAYLKAAGGRVLGTVFNGGRRSLPFHGAYHYGQLGAHSRRGDVVDGA